MYEATLAVSVTATACSCGRHVIVTERMLLTIEVVVPAAVFFGRSEPSFRAGQNGTQPHAAAGFGSPDDEGWWPMVDLEELLPVAFGKGGPGAPVTYV